MGGMNPMMMDPAMMGMGQGMNPMMVSGSTVPVGQPTVFGAAAHTLPCCCCRACRVWGWGCQAWVQCQAWAQAWGWEAWVQRQEEQWQEVWAVVTP